MDVELDNRTLSDDKNEFQEKIECHEARIKTLEREQAEEKAKFKVFERELGQEKNRNIESKDAQEHLETIKKQWAGMSGLMGCGGAMDVAGSAYVEITVVSQRLVKKEDIWYGVDGAVCCWSSEFLYLRISWVCHISVFKIEWVYIVAYFNAQLSVYRSHLSPVISLRQQ
jgi:hypothetical protein